MSNSFLSLNITDKHVFPAARTPGNVKSTANEIPVATEVGDNRSIEEGREVSWARRVAKDESTGKLPRNMRFWPPLDQNGRKIPKIEYADVRRMTEKWRNSAIGYVIGMDTPYTVMKRFADSRWATAGLLEVQRLHGGVFIFRFQSEQCMLEAVEASPMSLGNKMFIMQPWVKGGDMRKKDFKTVPVWIRLPGLEVQYYDVEALEKIVSAIGKPLYADKKTIEQERLAFARVCIEVSAGEKLPDQIEFINEDDILVSQPVQIEWMPSQCQQCKVFGHLTQNCPKHGEQRGKAKKTEYMPTGRRLQLGVNNSVISGRYEDGNGREEGKGEEKGQMEVGKTPPKTEVLELRRVSLGRQEREEEVRPSLSPAHTPMMPVWPSSPICMMNSYEVLSERPRKEQNATEGEEEQSFESESQEDLVVMDETLKQEKQEQKSGKGRKSRKKQGRRKRYYPNFL